VTTTSTITEVSPASAKGFEASGLNPSMF
jgi:hypothetical protein